MRARLWSNTMRFCFPIASALAANCFSTAAFAQVKTGLRWVNAATMQQPIEGVINPQNSIAKIPSLILLSEWRPEAKVSLGPKLDIVAKPRLSISQETTRAEGITRSKKANLDFFWKEAFGTLTASQVMQFSYGLQNFQWGPTESFSPTNGIVRDSGYSGSILSEPMAHELARVNFTPIQNFNAVILAETGPSRQREFLAESQFKKHLLAKVELSDNTMTNYLAITWGSSEDRYPYYGSYFNLQILDSWSLYADGIISSDTDAWYPKVDEKTGRGTEFEKDSSRHSRIFAVAGSRFSFLDNIDMRVEFIRYDSGYSNEQLARAVEAASTPSSNTLLNLSRYASPGLEISSRNSIYISQRYLNVASAHNFSEQIAYLHSLEDGSGVFFSSLSGVITKGVEGFFIVSMARGQTEGHLTRSTSWTASIGAITSW